MVVKLFDTHNALLVVGSNTICCIHCCAMLWYVCDTCGKGGSDSLVRVDGVVEEQAHAACQTVSNLCVGNEGRYFWL